MKKYILFILILFPIKVYALDLPEINSQNVLIYDLSEDKIIYEKNSDIKTSIASLTKILTSMVAIENIPNLDESIQVTNKMLSNIYWNASRAGLKNGDIVTYKDLLYALLLPSGADAAQVLALNLASSKEEYVTKMNALASKIGMNNSNFVNTTGLDTNNQYSTLNDVLILLKYALKNPTFKEVFTTKEYTLSNNLTVKSTLKYYQEKYDLDISQILGSKTGTTDNAGLCLASYFMIKNHEIISITTKAPLSDIPYNLIDTLNIIDYLNENYNISEEKKYQENVYSFQEPKEIKNASMKEIYIDDEKRFELIKWMKHFIKKYQTTKEGKGLYLYGSFGSGKTYLLSAMFNELAKKGIKSAIVFWPEYLANLKGYFKTGEYIDQIDYLKKVPLLLIDDIGAENSTSWSRDEVLSPILQYRMQEGLTTFFTSNLDKKSLEEHLSISKDGIEGIKARRILERINQLTEEMSLMSKNLRK